MSIFKVKIKYILTSRPAPIFVKNRCWTGNYRIWSRIW